MFVTSTLIDAKRIADNNIRNCPEIGKKKNKNENKTIISFIFQK